MRAIQKCNKNDQPNCMSYFIPFLSSFFLSLVWVCVCGGQSCCFRNILWIIFPLFGLLFVLQAICENLFIFLYCPRLPRYCPAQNRIAQKRPKNNKFHVFIERNWTKKIKLPRSKLDCLHTTHTHTHTHTHTASSISSSLTYRPTTLTLPTRSVKRSAHSPYPPQTHVPTPTQQQASKKQQTTTSIAYPINHYLNNPPQPLPNPATHSQSHKPRK